MCIRDRPNGISIGSDVFAEFIPITYKQTDRPRHVRSNTLHLYTMHTLRRKNKVTSLAATLLQMSSEPSDLLKIFAVTSRPSQMLRGNVADFNYHSFTVMSWSAWVLLCVQGIIRDTGCTAAAEACSNASFLVSMLLFFCASVYILCDFWLLWVWLLVWTMHQSWFVW